MELMLSLAIISLLCTAMVFGACGIASRSDAFHPGDCPSCSPDEAASEETHQTPIAN